MTSYTLEVRSNCLIKEYWISSADPEFLSVRTVGATEEHFVVDKSLSYRIIDVGVSRIQRNVWAAFFEDATAIIFLAPISAFDEVS
jgi:hypothetical protein